MIRAMRGYGQFCPVALTMEVIGERWTLLVVRELLCGSRRFTDIAQGVPLMSRTMLSQRLRSLEHGGVVTRRGREYHLTEAGEELRPIVEQCGVWGQRWVRRKLTPDELDPALLLWDMRRNLSRDALPAARTTVEFRFRNAPRGKNRYWLVVDGEDVDVCLTYQGFDVDVTVDAQLRAMIEVWMGHTTFEQAVREQRIALEGPRDLVRAFPSWLALSVFAHVPRPA